MKTFIIDGYNVIYKIPRLESKLDNSLQSARQALVDFIRANKPQASEYVVVFEGKDEYIGAGPLNNGNIRLIFTRSHEEADRRIIDMLKAADNTQGFVVVSDDNYVRNHAKAFGAQGESAEDFFKTKKHKSLFARSACEINITDSRKINEELKKVWKI